MTLCQRYASITCMQRFHSSPLDLNASLRPQALWDRAGEGFGLVALDWHAPLPATILPGWRVCWLPTGRFVSLWLAAPTTQARARVCEPEFQLQLCSCDYLQLHSRGRGFSHSATSCCCCRLCKATPAPLFGRMSFRLLKR